MHSVSCGSGVRIAGGATSQASSAQESVRYFLPAQLRQARAAKILGFNCLHPAGVSVACWKKPSPYWRLVEAWADGEDRGRRD